MSTRAIVLVLRFTLLVIGATFCWSANAGDGPQPGNRYKIIGPAYAIGVYRDLNNRQLNREQSWVSLSPVRVSGPEIAFLQNVPLGTTMIIVDHAPKRTTLPFFASRYFARLDPDLSRGLDVVLELNRGIEGDLDGLNLEVFQRYDGTQ